ncbi:hypothetical protein [Lyngbya sp. CCY1209]|uniref:hypothetical protein n=1 Tax=Lyngbya sp. CCY1209 TaxID=2886103 RepID=UPI002D2105E2|nr:hypothetical protein [Lyngbya sp. CCY1209]MEB3884061.1 hypothetical protein [Lyngbya sp. CCY1209]
MSEKMEKLRSYLKVHAEFCTTANSRFDAQYKCNESLILAYGIPFEKRVDPAPIPGEPKSCYKNCYEGLLLHSNWHYCEGFATHENLPLALIHAWLVNDRGEVIDPTWTNRGGTAYFGVVFERKFVGERVEAARQYAILDSDYKFDFPLLKYGFADGMLNPKFHSRSREGRRHE